MERARKRFGSLTSVTSMATRLPAAVVGISLFSIVVAGVVAISTGRDLGRDISDDRIAALRSSGAFDVAAHMTALERTAEALAVSPQAATALDAFGDGYDDLLDLRREALETEAQQVIAYDQEQYLAPLRSAGRNVQLRDIRPGNVAGEYLQYHYAVDLGAVEEAESVDDADDGSRWSEVHRAVHPVYRDVVARRDLVDLLLVEPDDGYVVYSVRKRPDLGTSLDVGPFSGSLVSDIVQRVRDNPSAGPITSDLRFYDPALTTPVGAVAHPITDGDRLAGVLVLLYDSGPLTGILSADGNWDAVGFPPTGESYLLGADGTTRSDPRPFLEDPNAYLDAAASTGLLSGPERSAVEASGTTVLSQRGDEATVDAGRDGDQSVQKRSTIVGGEAFSSVAPVGVGDLDWSVVTEIELDQAEAELGDFQDLLVVGTATFVVAVAFLAVVWAGRIVRPIRAISNRLASGTRGEGPIEVPPRSPIEFHRLAASFESMSSALDERHSRLADVRQERLEVLRKMIPPAMADRVATGDIQSFEQVPQASVVVAVILGLGELVRTDGGGSDRALLDRGLAELDHLAHRHGVERVKVVGDAFFAACGHDRPYIDHAPRAVAFAADARDAVCDLGSETAAGLDMAAGIHTGPVTVGMTPGERLLYDVWGETVTVAHHLARRAGPGVVLVSDETKAVLPDTIEVHDEGSNDRSMWSVARASVRGTT